MTEEIGGGVAIDKEILPSQRDFFPTYTEFLKKGSTQIIKSQSVLGGVRSTVYLVPDGYEFFCCGAHISAGATAAGTSQIHINGGEILLFLRNAANTSNQLATPFNPPLKLETATLIELQSNNANVLSTGGIYGFLVKKPVI